MQNKSRENVLLNGWLHGNKSYGELLISEAYPRVFKYVSSYVSINVNNRQKVIEDIVQEAFVRAMGAVAFFNVKYMFYTWICGYAKLCIKEKWRELKKLGNTEPFDDIIDIYESTGTFYYNPEQYVIIKEEYQALQTAYKALKKDISMHLKKPVDNLESLLIRKLNMRQNGPKIRELQTAAQKVILNLQNQSIIPGKFWNLYALNCFYSYLSNMQADSLKECVNIYERHFV